MGQRRRFTPEFKRQAVQLLNAGQRPAAEIARELGVPRNRLYKWQKTWSRMGGIPWVRAASGAGGRTGAPQARISSSHGGARHFKQSRGRFRRSTQHPLGYSGVGG